MLPLEGVTVISLEQAVAAPFATRQLADLGLRHVVLMPAVFVQGEDMELSRTLLEQELVPALKELSVARY